MSKNIDTNVVEMKFDNKEFEKDVSTTMSSVKKLKESLNFIGSGKGLDSLEKAADAVAVKFSYMQAAISSQINRMVDNVVNSAERMVKSLTIDPIKTGFSEYETQINAVQTILANTSAKGTTMDDVNKALDTLNTYADKTIYNFTEMTRNIGTFTAAGIDLDTSVNAIQGIANLAAVSGSTSQQASTAMYQLSQALSSGTVKLQDWNSVVNAGMGGQVFQDALKETARVSGVEIDKMIEKEGSFRETLKNGWITSEILTKTLQKFTLTTEGLTEAEIEKNREMLRGQGYTEKQIDEIFKLGATATDAATKVKTFSQLFDTLKEAAQSGWTQSWEIIVGDFEEAKKLLTKVSDTIGTIIGNSAKARNDMLQGWKDLGGRDDVIAIFKNLYEAASDLIKPIKEAWESIFPPMTAKRLKEITGNIKEFTENLYIKPEAAKSLKEAAKGLFSLVDIFLSIGKGGIFGALKLISDILGLTAEDVVNLLGFVGKGIQAFRDWFRESEFLQNALLFVYGAVKKLSTIIYDFVTGNDGRIEAFWQFLRKIFRKVSDWLKSIGVSTENLKKIFNNFRRGVKNALSDLGFDPVIFDAFRESLKKAKEAIKDFFSGKDDGTGLIQKIQDSFGIFGDFMSAFFANFSANFENFKAGLKKAAIAIGGVFVWVKDRVVDCYNFLSKTFSNTTLGALLTAGLGTGMIFLIKKLSDLMDGIGSLVKGTLELPGKLGKMLKSISKVLNAFAFSVKAKALKHVSIAILILAGAIAVLAHIPAEKLEPAVNAFLKIAAALSVIILVLSLLSSKMKKIKELKDVKSNAMQVVDSLKVYIAIFSIASSLLMIAGAMKILSTLKPEEIIQGVTAVLVILTAITFMMMAMHKYAPTLSKGSSIFLSIGFSLILIAAAMKIIATMNTEEAIRAIGTVAVVIGMLSVLAMACRTTEKDAIGLKGAGSSIFKIALSLLVIVLALKAMAKAFYDINNEYGEGAFENSLLFIVGIVGGLAVFANYISNSGKNASKVGSMLLKLALSLVVIGLAIKIIAKTFNENPVSTVAAILGIVAILGAFTAIIYQLRKIPTINKWEKGQSPAGTIMAIAAAIAAIGLAVSLMSLQDPTGLLISVASVVTIMGMFAKIISSTKGSSDGTKTIIAMTVAILAITVALASLSSINVGLLLSAGGTLGLVAGMFALTIKHLSKIGSSKAIGIILSMALAVGILGHVLHSIADMPVGKALAAAGSLSLVMLTLALAVNMVANLKAKALLGAAAFAIMSASLIGIAFALKMLHDVSWADFGMAAAAIGIFVGVLTALTIVCATGVGGVALAAAVGILLGLAVAALVFAKACRTVSDAVLTFAKALTMLSEIGPAAASRLEGLLYLIPVACRKVGEGVAEFFTGLIKTVLKSAGEIGVAFSVMILTIMKVIGEYIPAFVTEGFNMVIAFINGMAAALNENTQPLIEAFNNLAIAIKEAVKSVLFGGLKSAWEGIKGFFGFETTDEVTSNFDNLLPVYQGAGSDLSGAFATSFATNDATTKSADTMSVSMLDTLAGYSEDFNLSGSGDIVSMANGMLSKQDFLNTSAGSLAHGAISTMKNIFDQNSPSKVFEQIGKYNVEGLANGLRKYVGLAENASADVGKATLRPVYDMTSDINASGSMLSTAFQKASDTAKKTSASFSSEESVTVKHTFDKITVEGVNNQGEFMGVANYAVEEVVASLMRRQSRL